MPIIPERLGESKRTLIELTEEELTELQTIVRGTKSERRMVDRAKIILAWHEGKRFVETHQEASMSEMAISKWRHRFKEQRLEGLRDARGKPPIYSAAEKAKVIKMATENQARDTVDGAKRHIAKRAGMSQSKVHQLLKQTDLKPHKIDYWCGKVPILSSKQKCSISLTCI